MLTDRNVENTPDPVLRVETTDTAPGLQAAVKPDSRKQGSDLDDPPSSFDGVFEGGGVKGIAHVGAYTTLYNRGYRIRNAAGTSAGAIVACLIAAGYDTPVDLQRLFLQAPLPTFPHENWWEAHLDIPAKLVTVGIHDGIYDTSAFRHWLTGLLDAKNIRTFGDLICDAAEPVDSPWRYKLQVVASDVTLGRKIVWPRDAHLYNLDPDAFPVADAVVMSMSIPFYFQPYKLDYKDRDGKPLASLVVDGGLLSNFPVDLFDVPAGKTPEWPTFGCKLVESKKERSNDTSNLLSFTDAVVTTALEGNDDLYLAEHKFVRTIPIVTPDSIQATDWDIDQQQRLSLFQAGVDAANEFLGRWHFAAYKALYRSRNPVPKRSDRIKARITKAIPAAKPNVTGIAPSSAGVIP